MSWDIVLFNSKKTINSIEEFDKKNLVPTDFTQILEKSFNDVIKDGDYREVNGKDFSIEFSIDEEKESNKLLSLHGEKGLFALIELAKQHGWQIFDIGLGSMIDLQNPENNGYENHRKYIAQVIKQMKE